MRLMLALALLVTVSTAHYQVSLLRLRGKPPIQTALAADPHLRCTILCAG